MKHNTIDYRNFMHCLTMAKNIDKTVTEFRTVQVFNLEGDLESLGECAKI